MVLLAATSTAGAQDEAAKASAKPQVVCLTSYRPPRGVYRRKPHKCALHHRNSYPVTSANTKKMTHIRWNGHWGQRRAIGRGKLVTSHGLAPTKVTLRKPRHLCGHDVFTRASFVIHVHDTEQRHIRMPLDDCLV